MDRALIASNPTVMMGKPVIAGTRITVESILERLAAGESKADLLAAHPRLTDEAVSAALRFAADVLRSDVVYPVADLDPRCIWLQMKVSTDRSSSDHAPTGIV